jgi:outer membrane biosynthesis protein TonB
VNWGSATGSLSVRVTAVKGDLHAGALIEQNVIAAGTKRPASASVTPFPSTEPNTKPNTQPTPQPSNQPRNEQPTPATVQASAAKVKTPGVPASVAAIHTGAAPDQTAPETAASNDSVSVVNTSGSKGGGSNTKKWVIVAAIVAGAGIGAALALGGKGGAVTTSSASSGTSIGSPTVSIGH